jgi:hypothetical protein
MAEDKNQKETLTPNLAGYPQNFLLRWSAPSFTNPKKTRNWYIVTGAVTLALVAFSIVVGSYLGAILFVLMGIVIFLYASREPSQVFAGVTPEGIFFGNRLYFFSDLDSFWLFYDPPDLKEISLKSNKMIMPVIKVQLGDQDPVAVRTLLLKFLKEKEQEESMIDLIARRLKF